MGHAASCCQTSNQQDNVESYVVEANRRLIGFGQMNILEFELRVKQFAFPTNKGFVNTVQLGEAFKDTEIFS